MSDEHCPAITAIVIIASVVISTGILLGTSINKLESTQYGVEYAKFSKKLDDAVKTGGRHAGPPGFKFIKFPSTFVTKLLPTGTCVSADGLRVDYTVSFQYQITEEDIMPVILTYRDFDNWDEIVAEAGISAVHHACADFNISNFQNARGLIQLRMEDRLRDKLEGNNTTETGLYATTIALQLQNVNLPEEYTEAVVTKQKATEDIQLARNERTQVLTIANTTLLEAGEEALRINDEAANNASIILTQARLKAEEITVSYTSEAEVIMDVKRRLNLTNEGVLSYLVNRLYAQAPSLRVKSVEPAQLSFKDSL